MDYNPLIQDLLRPTEADLDPDIEDQAPEQEADTLENELEEAQITPQLKLDYTLKTCQERADLVNKIVALTPQEKLTSRYLELLGDYIMGGITKEEKKEHLYMTDNRRITIDKRETSFEGLAEKFENGTDGIYHLITNDKNIIFQHKDEITADDIKTIPGLKELRELITETEIACKAATGRKKYLLKKQLIDLQKDQYVLKNSYKVPIRITPSIKGTSRIDLSDTPFLNEQGEPQSTGLISFFNPEHISAILCHYNGLYIETRGRYQDDFFYLLEDFTALTKRALEPYPAYYMIVVEKLHGASNNKIQQELMSQYNISHSIQYISQLWRNKIPKIIAEKAQDEFLYNHYTMYLPDKMKQCSCCGEKKPASTRFFSKNRTSKDGWYSWCKECRKNQNAKLK